MLAQVTQLFVVAIVAGAALLWLIHKMDWNIAWFIVISIVVLFLLSIIVGYATWPSHGIRDSELMRTLTHVGARTFYL